MANPKRGKRRAKRRAARVVTKTVYRTRRRSGRRYARRVGAYAKSTIMGLNIPAAAKNALPLFLGALLAKAAAKKLADSGGENENWTWKNYLLAMAGGAGGAILAQAIFKRPGLAQKILEGATLLTLYKVWTNEIAPKNATLQAWFGADDESADPYAGLMQDADPYAGLMEDADPYAGLFGPVTESPEGDYTADGLAYRGYGGRVVDAGPRMGGDVVDAGPRMGGVSQQVTEMFNRAYR